MANTVHIACAGRARGESSSAPAAPILASDGDHTLEKPEAHSVSRSSPDTPLSDRLNRSYAETPSRGSRSAKTGTAALPGCDRTPHADEVSCSASGSLSDQSINLCFNSASPGGAYRAAQSSPYLAAASASAVAAQRGCHQDTADPAAALGPVLAFKDAQGALLNSKHARLCRKTEVSGRAGYPCLAPVMTGILPCGKRSRGCPLHDLCAYASYVIVKTGKDRIQGVYNCRQDSTALEDIGLQGFATTPLPGAGTLVGTTPGSCAGSCRGSRAARNSQAAPAG